MIVGNEVPIAAQLCDGATDQYPQAEIYDNEGTHLTTLSLSHTGNGLYQPASAYTMPDKDYIQVVYIVYSDAGHTVESLTYARAVDVFVQTPDTSFLVDIEGGRWKIENNQMIFYKSDNTTIVAQFDLFDADGNPASTNVYERRRV